MTEMESLLAQVRALQEQNASLQAQLASTLKLKVSENGALSIYGLQKFPVTLYKEQWERIFKAMPTIQQFIKDNAGLLKSKSDKQDKPAVQSLADYQAARAIDGRG